MDRYLNGSWIIRDPPWAAGRPYSPAYLIALGVSQYAQWIADTPKLRGRQSVRTTAREDGRNAGTVSRDRLALQRLGLQLRITTRGRNGGTTIYRAKPAAGPPALAAHRRTLRRMLGAAAELAPAELAPAELRAPPLELEAPAEACTCGAPGCTGTRGRY